MPSTKRRPATRSPKQNGSPISLMLVDDHPIWRQTLRKILERRRFCRVVAEAGDGTEAVQLAGPASPDVVVMDIQLPRQNGIDATADLVAAHPDIRVLVLASSENRAQVIAAVQAGASGYLLKTAEADEVREAVRRVHAGELVFPPSLAEIVLTELRDRGPDRNGKTAGNSFNREGDFWTITYEGHVFRLRDTRGVRYLAQLVQHPGREFHSLDLVAVDRASPGLAPDKGAGPVLDEKAKKAYARRILELESELEEAEKWGDTGRATKAGAEIDAITEQLSAAVGLGGRDRTAASAAERARVNVTLAIKSTLKKIAEHAPDLFEHFSTTIHTGVYCSYTPDARAPIAWN